MEALVIRQKYPPLDIAKDGFIIRREYRGDHFLFAFPNGDSWELSRDNAETFLRMMKEPIGFKILDYVWNFYAAFVSIVDGEWSMKPMTPYQAEQYTGPSAKVMF